MEHRQAQTGHDVIVGLMARYSQTRDLVSALDWALPELLGQATAQAGSMFLHREASEELECVCSHGPVDVRGLRVAEASGLVGQVFTTRQSVLVADAQNDSRHNKAVDQRTGFRTISTLTVPILFGDRCFGSLQAINRLDINGHPCAFEPVHQHDFEAAAVALGVALHNLHLAQEMVQHELIQRDVQAAEETQAHLFPSLQQSPLVTGRVLPARRLSGDFIDMVEHDGLLYLIEGDVSGKGIPAALTVARCLALFRLFARQRLKVNDLAAAINDELFELGERLESSAGFVTAFVGVLDLKTLMLSGVNCGHGELLLIHQGTGEFEAIPAGDPPLGVLSTEDLCLTVFERGLSDARLCVFSDGVTEATFCETELGFSGIRKLLLAVRALPLVESLEQITGLFDRRRLLTQDDATLMLVGR